MSVSETESQGTADHRAHARELKQEIESFHRFARAFERGDYRAVVTLEKDVTRFAKRSKGIDLKAVHNIYRCLGIAFFEEKMYNQSIRYLKKFLEFAKSDYNWNGVIETHKTLAKAYQLLNKTDKAIKHYQSLVKAYQATSRFSEIAGVSTELALLYSFKGKYANAKKILLNHHEADPSVSQVPADDPLPSWGELDTDSVVDEFARLALELEGNQFGYFSPSSEDSSPRKHRDGARCKRRTRVEFETCREDFCAQHRVTRLRG